MSTCDVQSWFNGAALVNYTWRYVITTFQDVIWLFVAESAVSQSVSQSVSSRFVWLRALTMVADVFSQRSGASPWMTLDRWMTFNCVDLWCHVTRSSIASNSTTICSTVWRQQDVVWRVDRNGTSKCCRPARRLLHCSTWYRTKVPPIFGVSLFAWVRQSSSDWWWRFLLKMQVFTGKKTSSRFSRYCSVAGSEYRFSGKLRLLMHFFYKSFQGLPSCTAKFFLHGESYFWRVLAISCIQ